MDKQKYKQKAFRERIANSSATIRIATLSLIYGIWLEMNPSILVRYYIFELLEGLFNPRLISYAHILFSLGLIVGVVFQNKNFKNFSLISVTVLWTTMAVSAFVSPPPNAIWIYCGFISIFCYESIWME